MTLTETPTFQIVGSYKGGKYEDIEIVYGEKNKEYLVSEYRIAYGNNWHIVAYRIDE
jgi:hypothetical protein